MIPTTLLVFPDTEIAYVKVGSNSIIGVVADQSPKAKFVSEELEFVPVTFIPPSVVGVIVIAFKVFVPRILLSSLFFPFLFHTSSPLLGSLALTSAHVSL